MADGENKSPGVTWAQTVRDVLIASMTKGQFPLALFGLIILVMILKVPPDKVAELVDRLMTDLENFSLTGYALALIILAGWYVHAKRQRRIMAEEMERITEERNKLQSSTLGSDRVQSSGGA